MIAGIILAGGKGTRLNSVDVNKVTLPFAGKPMIQYGVELLRPFVSELVVVIGAYAESVKEALKDYDVTYAFQEEQKGTGHAVQVALPYLSSHIANVLVGYGDHMMFYKPKTVEKLIQTHVEQHAAITVVTTQVENPFAYGRVLRDEDNNVYGIVEEKAATPQQKMITEINAGFYCFDNSFLRSGIHDIKPSSASGELYLTDMVEIALKKKQQVVDFKVPYREVGIGINTKEELSESVALYNSTK